MVLGGFRSFHVLVTTLPYVGEVPKNNVVELYREALVLCGITWMQLEDILRNYFSVFLCYIDLSLLLQVSMIWCVL